MRLLVCPECGTVKPTHPEDAERGLFVRYVRGILKRSGSVCDKCNLHLNAGDEVVAISQPATMGRWEDEYMEVAT